MVWVVAIVFLGAFVVADVGCKTDPDVCVSHGWCILTTMPLLDSIAQYWLVVLTPVPESVPHALQAERTAACHCTKESFLM